MSYRPRITWTPARLDMIRTLAADGKSTVEIAAHFGTTPGALRTVMSKRKITSGVPVGRRKLPIPPLPGGWVWGVTRAAPITGRTRRHIIIVVRNRTACDALGRIDPDVSGSTCELCLAALRRAVG